MINFKPIRRNFFESVLFIVILISTVLVGFIKGDYLIAIISAVCGMTYTFLAGKGKPQCYLFGLAGSGFYCWLSFQNALWGNLLLYGCYYIPMQIIGFLHWNKNLKDDNYEIVKISVPRQEMLLISFLSLLALFVTFHLLIYFHDTNPFLDAITTVLSVTGMYFTVRRAIQQWLIWIVVNAFSLIMWLRIAISGQRVFSTVLMWTVYLFLAVYFYYLWKKEITEKLQ